MHVIHDEWLVLVRVCQPSAELNECWPVKTAVYARCGCAWHSCLCIVWRRMVCVSPLRVVFVCLGTCKLFSHSEPTIARSPRVISLDVVPFGGRTNYFLAT